MNSPKTLFLTCEPYRMSFLNTHARRIPHPVGAWVRRANTNRFISIRVEDSRRLRWGIFNVNQ